MNKTMKIILGIAAFAGVVAASTIAIIKVRRGREFEKAPRWGLIGGDDCNDVKNKFKEIARLFQRDIDNVERRTSDVYHKAKQKKYSSMDWDSEPVSRCDAMN